MNENTKKFPYSEEAERYILGCLLLDSSLVEQVLTEISSNDFHVRANKNIMVCIESLYKNNNPIEAVRVLDELKRLNLEESTGGIDYLYSLLESVPSVANVEVYLNILHEKTLERQLLEVCNKISADILKGDDNISELIVKSEKQIMDVINGQRVSDFKRIDLLTDSVIDII